MQPCPLQVRKPELAVRRLVHAFVGSESQLGPAVQFSGSQGSIHAFTPPEGSRVNLVILLGGIWGCHSSPESSLLLGSRT